MERGQVKTVISNDLFDEDSLEYSVDPQRKSRAVRNANRLCLFPTVSDDPNVNLIRINSVILNKLNAGCNTRERKMIELLISGYNQTEAAQKLNVSQSMISRKIAKFKKFLSEGK